MQRLGNFFVCSLAPFKILAHEDMSIKLLPAFPTGFILF
jgi:hypothetical protein